MSLKTTAPTSLEVEFQSLAHQWREGCTLLSSTSAMVAHPAYQAIIELGQPVEPLLLRELEKEPAHWFEAQKPSRGKIPSRPKTGAIFRP